MRALNNMHNELLGNLSQKIDFFLGTFHHQQIVVLSYMLSAISLLCFIGYILYKAIYQKKILQQLNKKELFKKKQYHENHSSKN
ncbi:hypothetical protein [Bartonella vinsonii]|uniref:Heme exporter protein D n=1 Tax=Bartonella vinsonii subsp. berkhoffii str. Tweed TaxID=1094502 RepID=N6USZ7_BARVB|nr:hypothetical protein [Bartonella vinsonii]AGF75257.1 hypothetical protein BVwin_01000 [Bartonella vinsonii subsp. berkhoffii str. Winnie]ENN95449.1 hypothetical protein BVtw_01600 [Bartonella vinsonii subsp. berkhoffii str. Tweed]